MRSITTCTEPFKLKARIECVTPILTIALLATAPADSQLIDDVVVRNSPVGYSVRNEPSVPSTTVRLIAAAVASAGRPGVTRPGVSPAPAGGPLPPLASST